jgi:hypothetical protein
MEWRMMKMLKKIGLPMMALFGLLALAPLNQAKAAVRFGVYVGAPAYTYPVYPSYPVAPAPAYVYAAPVVPAPAYVYPYAAWGGRDFHGRDFHARGRR